jgi:isopentenyl diphosphate isomerase/L-lactate dehydrogenase-like FMN-dependent dehydrogenase
MIKGIVPVDDAKWAVDVGATAISVSNHGVNNLDGTPATIRTLPARSPTPSVTSWKSSSTQAADGAAT